MCVTATLIRCWHYTTNDLKIHITSPISVDYQIAMLCTQLPNCVHFLRREVRHHPGVVDLVRLRAHGLQNPITNMGSVSCSADVQ